MSKKNKQKTVINKKKQNIEEKGMRDVLLPILIVVAVLPFFVYLCVYSTGLGRYQWYADNDLAYDFFIFYRSRALIVVSAICAVILAFYLPLYKEKRKGCRIFIPLGIFAMWVLVATVLSCDKVLSLKGSIYSGETCFVLLAYLLILFYTYQMMQTQRDYKIIGIAFGVLMAGMLVIGYMQLFGKDPLDFEWVQRLVMSKELEARYVGSLADTFSTPHVYLTLFNPNYAAQLLAMQATFLFCLFWTENDKKKKSLWIILIVLTVILLYGTYSRMGLIAFFVGVIVAILWLGLQKKQMVWLAIITACLFVIVGLASVKSAKGDSFFQRSTDQFAEMKIQEVITDSEGVHITYQNETEHFVMTSPVLEGATDTYEEQTTCFHGEGTVRTVKQNGQEVLSIILDGQAWDFVFENGEYKYINPFGKTEKLSSIRKLDLHGLEAFASARGYIWSRTIPLLVDVKTLLVGCGPDAYITVFPQSDYVGKLYYSKNTSMVIDRPHSGYLQLLTQNGLPGFFCVFIFAICCMKKLLSERNTFACKAKEMNQKNLPFSDRMGYASIIAVIVFLFTLLTNDSTILITPIACVLLGISLAKA